MQGRSTDVLKIFRMNEAGEPGALQLLRRPAEVLYDMLVDGFDLTGRRQHLDPAGNAVHDQPRLALARKERLFCALLVVDIDPDRVPSDDASPCSSRKGTRRHRVPSILSIGAAYAHVDRERLPARQ